MPQAKICNLVKSVDIDLIQECHGFSRSNSEQDEHNRDKI
jgi:hypothetical protein